MRERPPSCSVGQHQLFQAEEIELLVRGSLEAFDVAQLKTATIYDGFHPQERTVL